MTTDLETLLIKLSICKEKGYKEQYKKYLHDLWLFHPTHYHKMMGTKVDPQQVIVKDNDGSDMLVGGLLGLGAGFLLGDIFD